MISYFNESFEKGNPGFPKRKVVFQPYTLSETSHLKIVGWKKILSFLLGPSAHEISGELLSFREGI